MIKIDDHLSIYPNPSSAIFKISQDNQQFKLIEVYSINGNLIQQKNITTTSEIIDLSGYAKGMYLLKLIGEERVVVKKIILSD